MRFREEREMALPVRRHFEDRGFGVKREFTTPWGVCDLVAAKLSPRRVKQRLALGQTQVIGRDLRVELLSRIPDERTGNSISIDRLEREFSDVLSPGALNEELEILGRRKFITAPRLGEVQKLNGWEPLQKNLIAIELKRARIREALRQAAAHLKFATESYVALPYELALRVRASRADAFRRTEVGLIGVREEDCRTLLRSRPSPGRADAVLRMHCVERFWPSTMKAYRTA